MSKDISKYRDEVMTHLKYIKEKVDANYSHLNRLNNRVRKAESSISWMKGIGTTVTFMLGTLFAWFKFDK